MRMHLSRLTVAMFIIVCGAAFASVGVRAANLDEACGGKDAITCNSALWCQKAEGQCAAADAPGKCDKAPTFCMRVSRPVCGCNGKTYANDCERQRVRVQLDHVGACKKETTTPAAPAKKKKATKGA
jgi:Kazal-type serine protease inhibitor domain